MTTITEADVEQVALEWLSGLGWGVAHGPDIAPGTPDAERDDYGQVVLDYRLRDALASLNPSIPDLGVWTTPAANSLVLKGQLQKPATGPFTGCSSTG